MEDEQPLVSGETETTISDEVEEETIVEEETTGEGVTIEEDEAPLISGGIQTPSEVTSSPSEGLPTIIIATIAAIALIGVAGIILLLLKRRKEEKENSRY